MLGQQVTSAFDHLVARVGTTVRYKRFRSSQYDPDLGTTKTFWEIVEFPAIVYSRTSREIPIEGGSLSDLDAIIVFKQNVFTKQPEETEEPRPSLGDEIEFDGKTWTVAEIGRRPFYQEDPTRTLYFVGVKHAV